MKKAAIAEYVTSSRVCFSSGVSIESTEKISFPIFPYSVSEPIFMTLTTALPCVTDVPV